MADPYNRDRQLFSRNALEGYYATWNHLATRTLQAGVIAGNTPCVTIDEISNIVYFAWADPAAWTRFETDNLITGVNLFISPALANYLGSAPALAMAGWIPAGWMMFYAQNRMRYVVITRDNFTDIEIWKDGVLLYTIDITLYGVLINPAMVVSPSGKWIVMTFTANNTYYVFEGI